MMVGCTLLFAPTPPAFWTLISVVALLMLRFAGAPKPPPDTTLKFERMLG